jgi:hypothetical protein
VQPFNDILARHRTPLLDLHGVVVSYTPVGGQAAQVRAIPDAGEPEGRPHAGGTRGVPVVVRIAKADVASVTVNGDTVAVPRQWVDPSDTGGGSVEVQVAAILGDRSGPFWRLRLRRIGGREGGA